MHYMRDTPYTQGNWRKGVKRKRIKHVVGYQTKNPEWLYVYYIKRISGQEVWLEMRKIKKHIQFLR